MTKDQIDSITAAVQVALGPELGNIHGRITEIAKSVSAIDERTKFMPTKESVLEAISSHASTCEAKRRWSIGLILGIPAIVASIVAVFTALHGCCEKDPYPGIGEGESCDMVAELRCNDERSQMCSIENRWETLYDCAGFGMSCCADAGVCCDADGGVDGGNTQ